MAALITFDGKNLVVQTGITRKRAVQLGKSWAKDHNDDPRWQTSDGNEVVVTVMKGT